MAGARTVAPQLWCESNGNQCDAEFNLLRVFKRATSFPGLDLVSWLGPQWLLLAPEELHPSCQTSNADPIRQLQASGAAEPPATYFRWWAYWHGSAHLCAD